MICLASWPTEVGCELLSDERRGGSCKAAGTSRRYERHTHPLESGCADERVRRTRARVFRLRRANARRSSVARQLRRTGLNSSSDVQAARRGLMSERSATAEVEVAADRAVCSPLSRTRSTLVGAGGDQLLRRSPRDRDANRARRGRPRAGGLRRRRARARTDHGVGAGRPPRIQELGRRQPGGRSLRVSRGRHPRAGYADARSGRREDVRLLAEDAPVVGLLVRQGPSQGDRAVQHRALLRQAGRSGALAAARLPAPLLDRRPRDRRRYVDRAPPRERGDSALRVRGRSRPDLHGHALGLRPRPRRPLRARKVGRGDDRHRDPPARIPRLRGEDSKGGVDSLRQARCRRVN